MPKKYKIKKTFTFEGKKYQVYGNTLDEVYEKKQKRLTELRSGRIIYSGDMLVKDWTEQALNTYKANVKNLDDAKSRINKHILSRIGNIPLKKVTAIQCQQILNEQSGMSHSHVTKLYQELQFIFSTALKNRLIAFDPTTDIIKPKGQKGRRRSLTERETAHFLKVCEEDDSFVLFELMYYCGCRPAEAIRAIGKDIQMEDGAPMLHIRGTKSDNSDRLVPIPAILYKKVRNTTPFAPIAPNKAYRAHSESSYNRLVSSLKRAMNISMGCKLYRNELLPPYPLADDFVPYDLRHTYCTNLAKAGVDIRVAKKLMGHSNISITADIYTHVDTKDITSAAKLINSFLG
jgi:integrase